MEKELQVNPWVRIWTRPRQVIRKILEFNPSYGLLPLCAAYGFPIVVHTARFFDLGSTLSLPLILVLSLVLSPLVGYVGISIWSCLAYWIGKWIKGRGSYVDVRCAVAWSNVPSIVSSACWIILSLLIGRSLFQAEYFVSGGLLAGFATLLFSVQVVASVWSLIIFVIALSEAQKFSIWRSIANILLPCVILFILGEIVSIFSW